MTAHSTTHILLVNTDEDEGCCQATTGSSWSMQDPLIQMAGRIARLARQQPSSLNMLLLPPMVGVETSDEAMIPEVLEDMHVMAIGDLA